MCKNCASTDYFTLTTEEASLLKYYAQSYNTIWDITNFFPYRRLIKGVAIGHSSVQLSQHHKIPGTIIKAEIVESFKNKDNKQIKEYYENYINDPINKETLTKMIHEVDTKNWKSMVDSVPIDKVDQVYKSIYWNQSNIEVGPKPELRINDPSQNSLLQLLTGGYDYGVMSDNERYKVYSLMNINDDILTNYPH